MLKEKARKNLKVADVALALGFVDAAASRYYYAAFQAAVHGLTRRGRTPGQFRAGAIEWDHVMVMHNVALVRGRRSDRELLRELRELRRTADYHDDSVESTELAAIVADARAFVEEVAE
jgi:uncharacterized protein (UPF0332 family)